MCTRAHSNPSKESCLCTAAQMQSTTCSTTTHTTHTHASTTNTHTHRPEKRCESCDGTRVRLRACCGPAALTKLRLVLFLSTVTALSTMHAQHAAPRSTAVRQHTTVTGLQLHDLNTSSHARRVCWWWLPTLRCCCRSADLSQTRTTH